MKLQVTESQLKLIEQQQLNELKWMGNIQSHIDRLDIPLTSSIVNYIWGKQRVTTFHIGDIHSIDKIAKMVGTRKALSTFRYMNKVMVNGIKGIQTTGGIIFQIEGDLQFEAPGDIMSTPDDSGRRWITLHTLPNKIRNEYYKEFKEHNEFNNINEPKTLIIYYRWVDNFIEERAKEIREYYSDFKIHREGLWNETVVNNIQIKDILWKEDIVGFLNTWETEEQKIKVLEEVGTKLSSISTGTVYLSDGGSTFGFRDINPVRWVEKRGGLTNFKKYVKKFHKEKEPRTISI